MKFVAVDNIPGRRCVTQNLVEKINAFADGENDIVRVEFDGDYKSVDSAYNALYKAAKRSGRAVKVVCRKKDVYLLKIKSE